MEGKECAQKRHKKASQNNWMRFKRRQKLPGWWGGNGGRENFGSGYTMDKDKEEERKEKISHYRKNLCIRGTNRMHIV